MKSETQRQAAKDKAPPKRKGPIEPMRALTQEEILAEAAQTEVRNLIDLERLLNMEEATKKKAERVKMNYAVGTMTYSPTTSSNAFATPSLEFSDVLLPGLALVPAFARFQLSLFKFEVSISRALLLDVAPHICPAPSVGGAHAAREVQGGHHHAGAALRRCDAGAPGRAPTDHPAARRLRHHRSRAGHMSLASSFDAINTTDAGSNALSDVPRIICLSLYWGAGQVHGPADGAPVRRRRSLRGGACQICMATSYSCNAF